MMLWESPTTAECPWCRGAFRSDEPRPGCNVCECCFCSERCRAEFHRSTVMLPHDFNQPLPE